MTTPRQPNEQPEHHDNDDAHEHPGRREADPQGFEGLDGDPADTDGHAPPERRRIEPGGFDGFRESRWGRTMQAVTDVLTQVIHWAPHALVSVVAIGALALIEVYLPADDQASPGRLILAALTRIIILVVVWLDYSRQLNTRQHQDDGQDNQEPAADEPDHDPAGEGEA